MFSVRSTLLLLLILLGTAISTQPLESSAHYSHLLLDNNYHAGKPDVVLVGASHSGVEPLLHYFLDWASESFCANPISETHSVSLTPWLCSTDSKLMKVSVVSFRELFGEQKLSYQDAKLVIVLREPVDRLIQIYANQLYSCRDQNEGGCSSTLLDFVSEHPKYFDDGVYVNDLEAIKEQFPMKHISILHADTIASDHASTFSHLQSFLNFENPKPLPPLSQTALFTSSVDDDSRITCSDYQHIKTRYEYFNQGLEHLISTLVSFPFSPMRSPEIYDTKCGPISLSDFNSSFVGPPHVMLIGTNKAGTTTLFSLMASYARAHSSMGRKETYFFSNRFKDPNFSRYVHDYYSKLISTYDFAIDATPCYFAREETLQKMLSVYDRNHFAQKKFVLSLREPVAKMLSFYKQRYDLCAQNKSRSSRAGCNDGVGSEYRDTFHDFMKRVEDDPDCGYSAGFYKEHLLRWLEVIPRRQIFIVNMEQLYNANGVKIIHALLEFVGRSGSPLKELAAEDVPHKNNAEDHCSECYEEDLAITCSDKEYLSALYAEQNQGLVDLINQGDRDPLEPLFLPFTELTACI